MVASCGSDAKVCVWNIEDFTQTITSSRTGSSRPAAPKDKLSARAIFEDHTATVEDCQFHPSNLNQICSVGQDKKLLIWDHRTSNRAQQVIPRHSEDINCVSWNKCDENLILTGSNDHLVQLTDLRNTKAPVHTFRAHKDTVTVVEWNPSSPHHFSSADEAGGLFIWDLQAIDSKESTSDEYPPELLFRHAGHRYFYICDMHWNPTVPWTLASVSQDGKLVWNL
eukprot:TRINITY_DN11106_c0_g1_i1.p1 TRINITY_DN11106_c0_g1~~TRINITY_DN11106_c0_g1_i1.p1  ORF type:complete len:246 (-),score=37.58 TRINITY_DN11106_c0_g1_i1:10-681(-)